MSIPDYQSLMRPVLMAASGGELRIGELVERLGRELSLTPEEVGTLLPSGKQTLFSNRVHWAKTYLGKAGLVESTRRGHFQITPRGRKVLETHPDRIDTAFLRKFEEFRRFAEPLTSQSTTSGADRPSSVSEAAIPSPSLPARTETPDEIMRSVHRQINASLAHDLLDRIQAAPPDFFERLIINLLLAMGFGGSADDAGRALGGSGDDGIDGVVDQDALGLDRVYVQAKRYATGNNIGSNAIRDFFGSLDRHKATKGLFVTTSSFTRDAKQTAEYLSKRIVLIDGEQLTKLMIRHNVGCRVEETLHIKKVDEEFFD